MRFLSVLGCMKRNIVKLAIKAVDTKEVLGVGDVGKVLTGLQDTIYHIGEYKFMRGSYRGQGKRDPVIEKRTKLIFKTFRPGSFIADLQGSDMQQALIGRPLVDDSIETLGVIFGSINGGDIDNMKLVLENEIKNPYYRSRILKDIVYYWPGGENNYQVQFATPSFKSNILKNENRPKINSLITVETKKEIGTVFGYLAKAETGQKNVIEIFGPYGKIKCSFSDKHKDTIRKFWDRIVDIEGEIKVDGLGDITEIPLIKNIHLKTTYTLERVIAETGEIQLKSPLDFSINYANKQWTFEHDALNIIVSNKSFETALTEVQDDIIALYDHYCINPPSKLGARAKTIQKLLSTCSGE